MSGQASIQLKSNGQVLAQSDDPTQVLQIEGNWYFHPDAVDMSRLEVSDRTYTCLYKGVC